MRREAAEADKAAAAASELFTDPAQRAQIDGLRRDFALYLADFEKIVAMSERRNQFVDDLNTVGPDA